MSVVLEQVRRPVIGFAAHEAVEIVEPHSRRPLIERARDAVLEVRRVVVLAEPRRGVTIVFQDPADGRIIRTDD